MNRIPLSIRLQRLESGEATNYTDIAIFNEMAYMPIGIYLGGFGDELDSFCGL